MKINIYTIVCWIISAQFALCQINYTVPTAIVVENSAYTAPVYDATVDIIMRENMGGDRRRPIATRIGQYRTDKTGIVTVSLEPNKSYTVTVARKGFYTQITKINTKDFSRTRQNRKGVSLRPRNVMAISGHIIAESYSQLLGQVSLTNLLTEHTDTKDLSADGTFFFKVLQGSDYKVRVVVDGLLDSIITLTEVDLQGSTTTDPYKVEINIGAPKPNYLKGDTLKLEDLLFAGRTTKMENEDWIDTLSSILAANPLVKMKINVHTDSRRSDRINYLLAKKRIAALKTKLGERGVSPRQYIFEAKGEDEVVNGCEDGVKCSKEEHAVNNRIVLIVASGKFLWDPNASF